MRRKSKIIYIIGTLITSVVFSLAILLALTAGGNVISKQIKLSFTSGSGTFEYDGEEHKVDEWKLIGGKLKDGHTLQVTVTGSQTDAGESPNFLSVRVVNGKGDDVTASYSIDYQTGIIVVEKRVLKVKSGSDSKDYDGTPLTNADVELTEGKLLKGHTFKAETTGTITDVGETKNTIVWTVTDKDGNDVSKNYKVESDLGTLKITDPTDGKTPGGTLLPSGDLGDDDGETSNPEEVIALKIRGEKDGTVYLRYSSFGDYGGTKWETGNRYGYNMLYETALLLKDNELSAYNASIISYSNYMLPYYTENDGGHEYQDNDVEFTGPINIEYSTKYYPFNYLSTGRLIESYIAKSTHVVDDEYTEFVYNNYLSVPASTREAMLRIIDEQNLSKDNIGRITDYIRGAAEYDLKYDRALDGEDDIAVAFLTKYKKGVCRHYASAGVLLLRTLGIPARYTTGYVANLKNDEWVAVTGDKAHAWVEMFVDGFGWVTLEVTGGIGDEQIDDEEKKPILTVFPETVYMKYDGVSVLKPNGAIQGRELEELIATKGYTYTAEVDGEQKEIGVGTSRILSFKLFDESGTDITDRYSIECKNGKLVVYYSILTMKSSDVEKTYDGTPLYGTGDGAEFFGELIAGHTVIFSDEFEQRTDVGTIKNAIKYIVKDENGNDVTDLYKVECDWGEITVNARKITITAASAEKNYDGEEFTAEGYEIQGDSEGGLADGHVVIAIKIAGGQTEIGRSDNIVSEVVIYDGEGNDVTKNYAVTYVKGKLVVKP